jgi:hypothetical protein
MSKIRRTMNADEARWTFASQPALEERALASHQIGGLKKGGGRQSVSFSTRLAEPIVREA